MNIQIVGTSHIARDSIEEIKKAVQEFQPDIIAVELDAQRAAALLSRQERSIPLAAIRAIRFKGFVFAKIGQIVQRKLGKIVGVSPGTEMKTALEIAKKKKIKVALIDQPITKTLHQFSSSLTWKEKGRFLSDLITGIIWKKKKMKEYGLDRLDLKKVPSEELIQMMMKPLQKRFPNVYKTLVTDRNTYMVKQLVRLLRNQKNAKILVIVGAGHKTGMEELLLKVEVV